MTDVYYEPSKLNQTQLNMFESNIREDRTSEDLLTQVILDLGLTLDLKIEEKEILGNKVYYVAGNSLVACFDNKINIDIINEICKIKPLKIVFRESSFSNDSDKINAYERIKKLSPETEISVI
jgi:adenine-specific DNA-methyltransferase